MDTIFSCASGAWAPFQDPSATEDEPQQVLLLTERINDWVGKETEAGRPPSFHSSKFETQERQILRVLRRNNHIIEDALKEWIEWIKWRAENKVDDIKETEIAQLKALGIAEWRGQDKEGRPSLVLTGRLLREGEYPEKISIFRKYAIYMAEQGVHMCNDKGVEHACILYDRRMLDFQHCDPNLHAGCKDTFSDIRRFYGDRIGNVYILNMNWLFFSVFSFVLKPLVSLFGNNGGKLNAVQEPAELSKWFDEEHMLLDETHLENLNPDPVAYEQEEIEMDPAYGITTRGVRLPGGMIITGLPEKPRAPKVIKLPTSETATNANTPGTAL
jgi:hypothetical protein